MQAELADMRHTADDPEVRRELAAVRQDLATARSDLAEIEAHRAESDLVLDRDRARLRELRQGRRNDARTTPLLPKTSWKTRRRAVEETLAQFAAAQHTREQVTLDVTDLLARAESEAAEILEPREPGRGDDSPGSGVLQRQQPVLRR